VIIHLLGFPGVGKSTIARALAAHANSAGVKLVAVDNHQTSNVVLGVVEADGFKALPTGVWERVAEIREIQYRTIEQLSPPDWSFAFTNVLVESDPMSPIVIARLTNLASARSTRYIPVILSCNPVELRRRVSSPDRVGRHKWTDPDAVAAFARGEQLLRPPDLTIEVDLTELSIEKSAQTVWELVSS
jgi:AAA domain